MDSLQQNESKIVITQDAIVSSVDHARRRRALELEYERRRKNLEIRRKSCQGNTIILSALEKTTHTHQGKMLYNNIYIGREKQNIDNLKT